MIKTTKCAVYNTETARLIKKVTHGFLGDPAGYEEILFETEEGKPFLYFRGGQDSPYPDEQIKASPAAVSAWKKQNLSRP